MEGRGALPQAEVRLYPCGEACGNGSRVRGLARPDADADLLITVPDAWLQRPNRVQLLDQLSRRLSGHRLTADLTARFSGGA